MKNKEDKVRDIAKQELRFAVHSYFNKDRSLDRCVLQKYARYALNALKNGRPPGTVS